MSQCWLHSLQVNPDETSIGLWRVGDIQSEQYGRFARGSQLASGLDGMYFRLNTSLWGGLPLSRPRLVTITVAYWDSGVGSWSLSYDGEEGPDTGNCTHHCFTVTKTDTRR